MSELPSFHKNVFVNCPFDSEYYPLFRPLIFTILYLGLTPRIAFERADSGELRLDKIRQLIRESRFSIHDLSRCRSIKAGEYFRLNMPLELGIDSGCKWYRVGKWKSKRFLILEKRKWGYQKALSDLAGSDIKSHGNDPIRLIEVVRNWLVQEAGGKPRPTSEIRIRYNTFMAEDFERLVRDGHTQRDVDRRPLNEVKSAMDSWIGSNTPQQRN